MRDQIETRNSFENNSAGGTLTTGPVVSGRAPEDGDGVLVIFWVYRAHEGSPRSLADQEDA